MKHMLCLMVAALAAVGCGGTVSLPGGTGGTGTTGGIGTPVSLGTLSAVGGITDMAVDDTNVYLADEGGQVIAVPIVGGSPTVLATLPSAYNDGLWLALDSANVYFAGGGTVASVPKGGGSMTTLVSGKSPGLGLAIAGKTLYFTESFTGTAATGDILGVSVAGGSVTTAAPNLDLPASLVSDGTHLYFISDGEVDSLSPGSTVQMLDTKTDAQQIVTDGAAVYWSEDHAMVATCGLCPPPPAPKPTDSSVYRLPVSGGSPTALATGYRIGAVASDGTSAYWFDSYVKTLSSVPISGGTPTVLAEQVTSAIGPVVHASAIYWVSATGEVMRLAPTSG